jgi:hypothetical protein
MYWLKRAACLALSVFFVVPNAVADTDAAAWQRAATQLSLWQHPYWHKLLHYQRSGDGVVSLAGGERLFVHEQGASQPQQELLATLAAFAENRWLPQRQEHALCAFPARLRWLKQRLQLRDADIPSFECPKRDLWQQEINPTSATLVFPDAYISSPGSMFGHTLLRVNGAKQGARAGLLAYAINYAADVRGVGPLEYAVKGIAGGFPGFFGLFPYYTKVKEYARIEHRDIWEYPLNLSELELQRVLEHVWELKQVPFRYFFFNQNCSWQLLALLEIARPGAELLNGFGIYAIPVDTVRRLQQQGFVAAQPKLRPSRQRALDGARQIMNAEQRRLVRQLMSGERLPNSPAFEQLTVAERALVFDTAYELLHNNYRRGQGEREVVLPRAYGILRARSALGLAPEPQLSADIVAPDQAHASARWGLALGSDARGTWLGLDIRAAFHDLLDPAEGFLPGYAIDFGRLQLRHYVEPARLELEELTLLSAISRNNWNAWAKPFSWGFSLGLKRPAWLKAADDDPRLGFTLEADGGVTVGSAKSHLMLGMALGAHWGSLLDRDGRLAAGPKLAAKLALSDKLSVVFETQYLASLAGLDMDDWTSELGLQWQLNRNQGLRLQGRLSQLESAPNDQEWSLTWLRYF